MGESTGFFGIRDHFRGPNGNSRPKPSLTKFLKKRICEALHFRGDLGEFIRISQVGDRVIKFGALQVPDDDTLGVHVFQDGDRPVGVCQETFTKGFEALLAQNVFVLAFTDKVASGIFRPTCAGVGKKKGPDRAAVGPRKFHGQFFAKDSCRFRPRGHLKRVLGGEKKGKTECFAGMRGNSVVGRLKKAVVNNRMVALLAGFQACNQRIRS